MILPKILDIPSKLLQIVEKFNQFRYFLLEGGRGSGKSHSVARFILFLCDKKKIRVICGRETQKSIEDSVFQLLVDLLMEHNLTNFEYNKSEIWNKKTGATIRFKGFREQGIVNIKSLEGCDLLWIEEAQSITEEVRKVIVPTIRKNNAKIFFTMNRFVRTDPAYTFCSKRNSALVIHIDYFENEYCPRNLINEANDCKEEDIAEYNHVWLGQPRSSTEEYVFDFDAVAKLPNVETMGDLLVPQKILAFDYASGGGDLSVCSELTRISMTQWELTYQEEWDEADVDKSIGRTVSLIGTRNPDVSILDADGMGWGVYCGVSNNKLVKNVVPFMGASTDKVTHQAANNKAEMYLTFSLWVNKGWLRIKSKKTIKQMETVKKEYQRNGKIIIENKQRAKKRGIKSPDNADSLGMAVFAAKHYVGKPAYSGRDEGGNIVRVNKRIGR